MFKWITALFKKLKGKSELQSKLDKEKLQSIREMSQAEIARLRIQALHSTSIQQQQQRNYYSRPSGSYPSSRTITTETSPPDNTLLHAAVAYSILSSDDNRSSYTPSVRDDDCRSSSNYDSGSSSSYDSSPSCSNYD